MYALPLYRYPETIVSHPVLLLASRSGIKINVMPVTWYVPLSVHPPLIGVSLSPSSCSYHLVRETGEFALCIPDETMLKEIHFCGVHTGHDVDKIRHLDIVTSRAREVSALLISNCIGHIECRISQNMQHGNRRFLISEVLSVTVQPIAWQDGWTDEFRLVHYLGGIDYRIGDETVKAAGILPGYVPPRRI